MPIIETVALSKIYPQARSFVKTVLHPFRKQKVTALREVSLCIGRGEIFGLLGPNGAGKTTLIKILSGLLLPSSGDARVLDLDVRSAAQAIKLKCGLVTSEERSFFWRLTGRENLDFFATLNRLDPATMQERIEAAVALVGLETKLDVRFDEYSTGMKQRLGIARGLLTAPEILFMDEPTKGLDPATARQLRQFIRTELVDAHGKTVIFATHDLAEAEQLCDSVAILDHGRVRFAGPVATLKQRVGDERYVIEVGDADADDALIEEIDAIAGVLHLDVQQRPPIVTLTLIMHDRVATLPVVFDTIHAHGGRVLGCRSSAPDLEHAFVHILEGRDPADAPGGRAV